MAVDLTTQILIDIREGIHATNDRLDRVVAEQIRHATAIIALEAGQRALAEGQREIVGALVRLNDNVERLGARVENVFSGALGQTARESAERLDALEHRVGELERRSA